MSRTALFLGGMWCAVAMVASPAVAHEPGLRAGAAVAEITPEVGAPIVGGFTPAPSKAIHDPLHARCLVLDDGTRRIALVVLDLLGIHRQVSDEARRRIQERFAIPAEAVLISATHTHSATSAIGGPAQPPAAAFAGIGNPAAFRGSLESCGARLAGFRGFPDHHAYTAADLDGLDRWADGLRADLVVTTLKDLVKIDRESLAGVPLVALEIAIDVTVGGDSLTAVVVQATGGRAAEPKA